MALASTQTLLSLDEFAQLMGISPWAFNQLDINFLLGDDVIKCPVWYQFEWQRYQTLTRETIARAISDAEAMLAEQLGYWPAPHYIVGEKIPYPRPHQADWWATWFNERWKLKDVRTEYGRIITPGIVAYDDISLDAAVTFDDTDGDTYDDWFTTAALPTSVVNASEIAAYIRVADRPDSMAADGEDVWRLRPVNVDLDAVAGTVTISGPIWLLVNPLYTIPPYPQPLDPSLVPPDPGTPFLDGIMVRRRYTDLTTQGHVYLEQIPCYTPPCVTIYADACFGERNARLGVVTPEATMSSTGLGPSCDAACGDYAPDFVSINYLSGYPLQDEPLRRVDKLHAQMIARLAASLLPDKSCVECVDTQITYWREFPRSAEGENIILSADGLNNPFGSRRGAIWAWQRTRELNAGKLAGAVR